ncbi:MAG: hypothetical protein Q4A07_08555 [Coriobacteriales bacterium]|nr:hypothetical protein [Coriobacteriales bacterium]
MDVDNKEMENELGFLQAMNAYRSAKAAGDAEAMRKAEDAWREQVRAELTGGRE